MKPCRRCAGTGEDIPIPKDAFTCFDCKKHCGSYMVKDSVWDKAWPEYRKLSVELIRKYKGTKEYWKQYLHLCLNCLMVRLKRPLRKEDFTGAPINDVVFVGISIGLEEAKD